MNGREWSEFLPIATPRIASHRADSKHLLSPLAGLADRPVRVDDGLWLLEGRAVGPGSGLPFDLPAEPLPRRLHHRRRSGHGDRLPGELALHRGRRGLPGHAHGQRRPPAVRAGLSRFPRQAPARLRHRCRAGRHRRLSPGAAAAGLRAASGGPVAGNRASEHHQLPDADCHQGLAAGAGGPRRAGAGIRTAAGPGHRRRLVGQPGGLHRRLRRDLERVGRPALRHSRPRHARPQLGHVP